MIIRDERFVPAPPAVCFRVAADVERWPEILPHYRWVRYHRKDGFGTGRVEMAAWRDFAGPLRYPTWWVSDMHVDAREPAMYFTHVDGITRRMDVKWAFEARDGGTHICITHGWDGPPWPLIGGFAWRHVIAPQFVSVIAQRTLAGVAREAERVARDPEASHVR
ncbi:MAG TPA: SRPBCC family protein [Longimicrobiales bacterium]|nr:SRPBCC family protein [Longimicrobiales bacterium]